MIYKIINKNRLLKGIVVLALILIVFFVKDKKSNSDIFVDEKKSDSPRQIIAEIPSTNTPKTDNTTDSNSSTTFQQKKTIEKPPSPTSTPKSTPKPASPKTKPEEIGLPNQATNTPEKVILQEKKPTEILPNSDSSNFRNIIALWVWSESYEIVTAENKQTEFFNFISKPHGEESAKINRIFLNGDSFSYSNTSNKSALRAFLKKSHDNGIAVEYLAGNSKWALSGNENLAIERCEKMTKFNSEATNQAERFDGVHLDIEPYLLSDWKINFSNGQDKYNDEIENNYLRILTSCNNIIKKENKKTSLSIDIPTWFAKATDIWDIVTSKTSPVDYITFMNYFDTEQTFLYGYDGANKSGGIGPNLRANTNIPMVFGAETIDLDPSSITFFEEGFASMNNVFKQARKKFDKENLFAGIAIHHYRTLKSLKD